ncbi:MAG: haloacid dehalogenase, partial [Candidatus Nanopelagicales bacterium]
EKLELNPEEVIVVEDSSNGLKAALAAGLKAVVTISSFTANEDFSGASLVVSSLGDAKGEKTTVVENSGNYPIGDEVKLSDLVQILNLTTRV